MNGIADSDTAGNLAPAEWPAMRGLDAAPARAAGRAALTGITPTFHEKFNNSGRLWGSDR